CNIEGRAVVDAGAYEGQAHRYIDALVNAHVLDRNKALVVVLGNHDVEFAPAGAHEHGIPWPGATGINTGGPGLFDGRRNDVDVFPSETSFFTGMRVQSGHCDTGLGNARLDAGTMGKPYGLQLKVLGDQGADLAERNMYGGHDNA